MSVLAGSRIGFTPCDREWSEGDGMEIRSPRYRGLIGEITVVGDSARANPGNTSP